MNIYTKCGEIAEKKIKNAYIYPPSLDNFLPICYDKT